MTDTPQKPSFKKLKPSFFDQVRQYDENLFNPDVDPADLEKHLSSLKKQAKTAIKKGTSDFALYWYGNALVTGDYGFSVDYEEGIALLEKAAANNMSWALHTLGDIYCGFIETQPKHLRSLRGLKYFKQVEDGYGNYRLACCYAYGKGVDSDPEIAKNYLETASNHYGCRHATLLMGIWYYEGTLYGQDYKKAYELFQVTQSEVQNAKDKETMSMLAETYFWNGLCLYNGHGIKKNKPEGQSLIKTAADMGNISAIEWLDSEETSGHMSAAFKPHIFSKYHAANEDEKPTEAFIKPRVTKEELENALAAFDGLIGLETVKSKVRELFYLEMLTQKRFEKGLNVPPPPSLHMVFTGNPGTGKTTVARMVGSLLRQTGHLQEGHVIEVDRSKLVGAYIGHSEAITNEILESARGGVLFIDEAYDLDQGVWWGDFGDVVTTLLVKAMEDMRGELVIIMAGYPERMKNFVDSNPGLRSRIGLILDFPDYTVGQMAKIYENYCTQSSYVISDLAGQKLWNILKYMPPAKREKFGNARGVRNLFEETLRLQAKRVIESDLEETEQLSLILPQDIPGEITPPDDSKIRYLSTRK